MRPSHSDSKLLKIMLYIESKSHEVMKHVKGCVKTVEPQRTPTGRMQRRFMYHVLVPQPPSRNDEISSVLPPFHLSTGAGSHPITQLSEHDCVSQCWTITIIQRSVPIHHVFLLHPHIQLCFIWQSQYKSSHSRIWIFNFSHLKATKVTFSCRTETMRGILILVWWICPLLCANQNVN